VITKTIKALAHRCGFDISRYRPDTNHAARFRHLLASTGVQRILDVGANEGQYGNLLRSEYDYHGEIVSFEPLPIAHAVLAQRAASDSLGSWRVAPRMALGATATTSTIEIAGNSVSSSLLPMESLHQQALPSSVNAGYAEVDVCPLDSAVADLGVAITNATLLKIDTQGYELEVLKGGPRTVGLVGAIQLEMSFTPLYTGQPLFPELFAYVEDKGFDVFDIVPGFCDPRTGRLLQVDGIFTRR
jgi:FkbM family methyltransferase